MARTSIMQELFVRVAIFIVAAAPLLRVSEASKMCNGGRLTYYVQVEIGAPNLAAILPPINAPLSGSFGQATVFAFNVTDGKSATSKPLGFVRGFTVETNYISGADIRLVEVEFLEYDDGRCKGTLQYQGVVTSQDSQLAVVGGSGSFRGVRGNVVVTVVSSNGNFRTYFHDVTLLT
ncbi:hypothetical protein KP509_10G051200 [Ceratopteris richardii]|uniref:Dirigent protein n=1 Tax=Ceratopteris richardii TaxID=49495 RepID=A0A8T2U0Z8_CERRI|nr:hypothetical protein KP509_10G051200 [Ceratopteris richardii]